MYTAKEFLVSKWNYFPSKIDEKNNAKIDAEKGMKINENTMRKWYQN